MDTLTSKFYSKNWLKAKCRECNFHIEENPRYVYIHCVICGLYICEKCQENYERHGCGRCYHTICHDCYKDRSDIRCCENPDIS